MTIDNIEELLKQWNVLHSKEYNFIRVFGNYNGYSIIRFNADDYQNPVEIDGKICSLSEFETWIFENCK